MEKIFKYLINVLRSGRAPYGVLWNSLSESEKKSFIKRTMTHQEFLNLRDRIFG